MSRNVKSVALTDVGKLRSKNEDNFIHVPGIWNKPGSALVGAIDGVGGYEGGAEAALLARQTIESYLKNLSFGEPAQLLLDAIVTANNRIFEERKANKKLNRMSCVLSLSLVDAEKEMMYIGHVGDSRGYVYRSGKLLKLTHDHSTVGAKEDSGYLTEEEAMNHPLRNEINRILGEQFLDAEDAKDFIEIAEHSFLPGDIVLFCSDGLTDLVTRAEIGSILTDAETLEVMARNLVARANALGGKDNITVALATYSVDEKIPLKPVAKGRSIEIPIAPNPAPSPGSGTIPVNQASTRGKTPWVIAIIVSFMLGFLANWNGTRQLFSTASPTNVLPVDSISSSQPRSGVDTLINATDTIMSKRDSSGRATDSVIP